MALAFGGGCADTGAEDVGGRRLLWHRWRDKQMAALFCKRIQRPQRREMLIWVNDLTQATF